MADYSEFHSGSKPQKSRSAAGKGRPAGGGAVFLFWLLLIVLALRFVFSMGTCAQRALQHESPYQYNYELPEIPEFPEIPKLPEMPEELREALFGETQP